MLEMTDKTLAGGKVKHVRERCEISVIFLIFSDLLNNLAEEGLTGRSLRDRVNRTIAIIEMVRVEASCQLSVRRSLRLLKFNLDFEYQ